MLMRVRSRAAIRRSIAIGTIEVACWDAVAKIADKPLHRVLAERYNGGTVQNKVQCYVGGGWYHEGKGLEHLQDEIRRRLGEGYTTMKIKVGGATIPEDVKRIEAALEVLGKGERLAVDANGAFDRARALAYAKALAPFELRWFEEPTDPLDYALLAELTGQYGSPIGTGENHLSPPMTSRTSCARRVCVPIATSSNRRTPVLRIVQFALPLAMPSGTAAASFDLSTRRHQMTLHIVGGFGLGALRGFIPTFSALSPVSPTMRASMTGGSSS